MEEVRADKEKVTIQLQGSKWSSLSDANAELSKYKSYCKDFESEIYDIDTDKTYNIKKSIEEFVSDDILKNRLELSKGHFPIEDYAIIEKKADEFVKFWADGAQKDDQKKDQTKVEYCDVLLCIKKDECKEYNKNTVEEVVKDCMSLCEILECKYHVDNIPHQNINHHNIFMNNNKNNKATVTLGNCGLSGMKNKIVWYNAPEILRGEKATVSSDVYSLGMWLYYMLKDGENVFAQKDRAGVEPEEIKLKPGAEFYSGIIKQALSINPDDRYKSCDEFKNALNKELKKNKQTSPKPSGVSNVVIFMIVALAIVAMAVVFMTIYNPMTEKNSGAEEIRTMISSGSYSLAYEEICKRQRDVSTDILIKEYIDGCIDDRDYARAVGIIDRFSQAEFDSPDYLEDMFEIFRSKGKIKLLLPMFEKIYTKSEAVARLIDRYRE